MSLDAVGVVCENLKESVRFYSLLGVSFVEFEGEEHFEGETPSGVRLMLDSEALMKKINPSWQKPVGSGVILCFKQQSSTQVDSVYNKIIQEGFNSIKSPWDAFWGQRYASVKDPNGNQVDIFANLQN